MSTSKKVTIVGAGLAGPLMAIFLALRGWEVDVFDARGDLRHETVTRGRSINLTIAARGIEALRRVGLDQEALDTLCTPLRARVLHDRTGTTRRVPYGVRHDEVLYSVSRTALTRFLLDAASMHPGVRLHFHHRCVAVDKATATATFVDGQTDERKIVPADLLIGADGVHSVVRRYMHRGELVDFSQHFVPWRYKELTITAGSGAGLDRNALHVWPRGTFMMFALPGRDSFNGVCVMPEYGETSFDAARTPDDVRALFEREFPDVVAHMPRLTEEFLGGAPGGFPTIRTSSWHHRDKVALLGDACHGVIPFYGQGMNAAFEDCVVLDACLARHWRNRAAALAEYERLRRAHTDVLADLSIANFEELRDTVRRPALAARKQVHQVAHRLLGDRAAPLYNLVSHSTLPYGECVEVARRRERVARLLGMDVAVAALVVHRTIKDGVRQRFGRDLLPSSADAGQAAQPRERRSAKAA